MLSQFEVSYAQTAAEFKTFQMTMRYNRFDIQYKINDEIYTKNRS